MSKILVTGANGQLGNELKVLAEGSTEHAWTWVDLSELDITDGAAVNAFLKAQPQDYIINCAAYTAVDKAESEEEVARAVNVRAVENLVKACEGSATCVLQISTDFVFEGKSCLPLAEDAPTAPLSVYGATKREGEQVLESSEAPYFIVRTSWLYSSFGGNFVKTMLRLGAERDTLGVVADQVGTPTYAADLAQVLVRLIETHEGGALEARKLYHYSNEGVASWYDFAQAIFERSGTAVTLNPIPTTAYPTPATRPAFSVLDKSALKADLNIRIPHWQESLAVCLQKLAATI